MQSKWALRLVTALLWALAAASAVYWGLRMASPIAAVSMHEASVVASAGDAPARQVAIARLLGAPAPVVAGPGPGPAERFALAGVIASVTGQGAALISVDGKPARPFAVGMEIAPGYLLRAVGLREAMLASDPQATVQVVLSLPEHRTATLAASPPATAPTAAVAAPSAGVSAAAPSANEQITDTGPPARADSRRQPPASLRHEDLRNP